MMKRKIESDDEIDEESFDFENPSKPQTSITSQISSSSSSRSSSNSLEPWVEKYKPLSTDALGINPTKLKQLRNYMTNMLLTRQKRILILTGPSGSGKSTSVKLLSKDITNGYIEYNDSEKFDEFLNDCKYLVGKNEKFIIVENLPNILHHETLMKFRESIENWLYIDQILPPLVIIITEIERKFGDSNNEFFNIENNFNINTIFSKKILFNHKIEMIKFNAIAKKFIMKPLKHIISKEIKRAIPTKTVDNFLQFIIELGDIRSSINNLELWSRFYIKGLDTTIDYTRNSTIDLFHAIGKIIYSSSKSRDLLEFEQINYTIDEIFKNFENFQLLNLSILENYSNFVNDNDFNKLEFIANKLSESDIIYKYNEGKDLMIRSTRVGLGDLNNVNNTNKGSITFTKNFNMLKEFNKVNKIINQLKDTPSFQTSFNNINLLDGFYVPIIMNKRQYKNYDRIGGKFKMLNDNLFDNDDIMTEFNFKFDEPLAEVDELSDPIDDSSDEIKIRKPLPQDSDYEFSDDSEFM